jgi:acyl-coenzyme A thioesterase PaaI-like protein
MGSDFSGQGTHFIMKFPVHIPFAELLGFELISLGDGQAQIDVLLRPELCNSWQMAHGGVTMTLLDVVTIEMKTSFMRPATGRLRGMGKMLTSTSSLAFCEGSVFDENDVLVAHATGTFKFLRNLSVGGRLVERVQASD